MLMEGSLLLDWRCTHMELMYTKRASVTRIKRVDSMGVPALKACEGDGQGSH